MYCSYCGSTYINTFCSICGSTYLTCGCNFAQIACDEHFCIECGEPYPELNDDGLCSNCEQEQIASEIK